MLPPHEGDHPNCANSDESEGRGFRDCGCTRTADGERIDLDACGGEIAKDGQGVIAGDAGTSEVAAAADYRIAA